MTLSVAVRDGAGRRVGFSLGALVLGVLAGLLWPSIAKSQPLLRESSVRYISGSALGMVSADARANLRNVELATSSDPYPGSRRAVEIHRVPEFTADVIGWVALGRVVWSSGNDQVAMSPKSWPRTAESYGRRFYTRSAQLVTIEVVRHSFAAALHRDPAYVRCACSGFGARFAHVAKGVVTDFDEEGARRIGWPRFAGALAGSAVLGQLQPGQGRPGTVAVRAATTVAGSFFGNAVKEIGLFGSGKPKLPPQEPNRGARDMF